MNTEIVKYEENRFTQLEKSVIEAFKAPLIKNISTYDLIRHIVNVINKAHVDYGITVKGETFEEQKNHIKVMAKEVMNDLKKRYPTLTVKEFEIAVENGIRKEYGEFFGINVSTINQFIKAYKKSEEREEAIRKLKLLRQEQEKEVIPTAEEIQRFMNESCLKAFQKYKENGSLIDLGGAKFKHLEALGIINHSLERKKEILAHAKQKCISEARQTILNSSRESNIRSIAFEVVKHPDNNEIVKNTAREMALKIFFDELIEMETELSELI